jgi:alkanesulfonate monooxygenase SsuD/methylene tetrahydromethanopterin reductase-like flavin-dependent oxidoreductase (luciferase family)
VVGSPRSQSSLFELARAWVRSVMHVDVLLDGFGTRWIDVLDAAEAAQAGGLDGVWLNDHLNGLVQGAPHVLECWTVLSALAGTVPRVVLGPLVLNVANRDAGTLAVMAATLQEVSGGRLMLGIGAGGRSGPYGREQEALGRTVASDSERRQAVEGTVETLRQVWSGGKTGKGGFLRPTPLPPILIAAFGLKMAELAGRVGDGICVQANARLPELAAVARQAHSEAGRDPRQFLLVATLGSVPDQTRQWAELDVDRLIVYVPPPFAEGIRQLAGTV